MTLTNAVSILPVPKYSEANVILVFAVLHFSNNAE